MADSTITLYDIPSKERCWSPNVWNTRLVLNYKELPFQTQWLEYPDLASTLAALGIPPNPPGSWSDYSCPTITLPNGEHVMDSQKIAYKLETLYPEPPLHLDSKVHESVQAALSPLFNALVPVILPAQQRSILEEPSASWHAQDREKKFGKSLDQLEKDEGGEKAWDAAQPGLEALKAELSKHKQGDGPYLMGREVSYGDFIVAGFFEWFRKADKGLYERLMAYDESFPRHHDACKPWLARDD